MKDNPVLGKYLADAINPDASSLVDVGGEELKAAYQRIEELEAALGNLVGLCDLIASRDDIDPDLKAILKAGWRRAEAEVSLSPFPSCAPGV